MKEETIEDRILRENVVQLTLAARSYFLRLPPNGATVHERNTVAAIIYQSGIMTKRKFGQNITGAELREKDKERYGKILDNVKIAVDKYGFRF